MQTKRLLTALSVLLCFGAVIAGVVLFQNKDYYLVTAAVLIFSCLPFCRNLKEIRTRELAIVAAMTALAVASRAAFYMLPAVKPLCAVAILTGLSFGPQIGFVTGAFAMFLSNFLFGQGAWTPFQVFGMGLTAFLASLLLRAMRRQTDRTVCALIGGAICFFVYGVIADSCSVLMMVNTYTWKSVLAVYASGVPFNAIHAVTTAVVLFFLTKPTAEKLGRMQTKYGLFS
ncbi:MAG: ECF transporter S component [Acutalibacteraceae bacterium]